MSNGKWAEKIAITVQDSMAKPPEYTILYRILNAPLKKDKYHHVASERDSDGYIVGILMPLMYDNKQTYFDQIKEHVSAGFVVEGVGHEYSRVNLDDFDEYYNGDDELYDEFDE